jgi:REP element-mobilizing transposase RayT
MKYNSERYHRRSIRLKGYDYSQPGAYFVTICTQDRECLFGEVVDGAIRLNKAGEIVWQTWHDLPDHIVNIVLDTFVVMPNHVHGIIIITDGQTPATDSDSASVDGVGADGVGADGVGAGSEPAPTRRYGLPEIIRQFKTFSARRINEIRNMQGVAVWQRNYYEHIIRDEQSLNRIREYILSNPSRWTMDRENPKKA